jgi:hypothetical protein
MTIETLSVFIRLLTMNGRKLLISTGSGARFPAKSYNNIKKKNAGEMLLADYNHFSWRVYGLKIWSDICVYSAVTVQ